MHPGGTRQGPENLTSVDRPRQTRLRSQRAFVLRKHRFFIPRMEPPEKEHRSDNEAEYEDEEVDPRIQVSVCQS